MTSQSLTSHLLSLQTTPSYAAATRHTFLTQAGNGTLPLPRLALWLSQDRIYAGHAYPRFIGSLISRIPFQEIDPVSGPQERQNQGILQLLVKCLDNIVQEVAFFWDTAEKSGLNMEGWIERKGTRDYTAEMARIASSAPFEDGLIFLWAMERVGIFIRSCGIHFDLNIYLGLFRCMVLRQTSPASLSETDQRGLMCSSCPQIRYELELSRV